MYIVIVKMLSDCQLDESYDICPGRAYGYHDVWCTLWECRSIRFDDEPPVREPLRVGGVPLYEAASVYELTMTSTKDDPYELRQFFSKIVQSKMFDVKHWEAVFELQKNGNPHIHACIWSSKKYCDGSKIKGKGINFPYRYEFKRVRDVDKYLLYMKKDLANNITIDYCAKKGIEHYWTKNAIIP